MKWDKEDLIKFIESNEFVSYDTFKVPIAQRTKVILTFHNGWQYANGRKTGVRYKILDKKKFKRIVAAGAYNCILNKDKKTFNASGSKGFLMWLR